MSDQLASTLRDLLFEHYTDEELATLCGAVGLDYAQLPGEGKFGKTRELVQAARARDRLRLLAARARDLRPEFAERLAAAMPAAPPAGEAPPPGQTGPISVATLRRWILPAAIVLVILLCVWAALSSGLGSALAPRGGVPTVSAPSAPAPAGGQTAPAPSAIPAATAPGGVVVATLIAPATPVRAGDATPAPTATKQPVIVPAPVISGTATPDIPVAPGAPDPARTVRELNAQLIDFYTGKLDGAALSQFWREGPRQSVLTFAESPLLKLLGLTAQARVDSLSVQMKYIKDPAVTSKVDARAIVESREYWRYANTKTNRVLCETRNYVYRMALENGRYVVDTFQGELVDTRCAE